MFSSIIDIAEDIELHGYCDSSEQGYCAVIYVQASSADQSTSASRIVTSKCKVTPMKKKSMPRLELLACVLLVELMWRLCKTLKGVKMIKEKHFWSDSEVALAWLKGEEGKAKWTPWVERRVKKVKKRSDAKEWDYVHTSINPADIGTREASAMKIKDNDL